MKARVIAANSVFFALEANGGIVVVELLTGSVQVGDVIAGDFRSHAGGTMQNETRQGAKLGIYLQAVDCSPEDALRDFGLRCPR